MTDSSVQEHVIQIIANQLSLKNDEVQPSLRLAEDLKMDELDKIELVLDLEEQFKTEILDDDSEKFITVQTVVDYLLRKVST